MQGELYRLDRRMHLKCSVALHEESTSSESEVRILRKARCLEHCPAISKNNSIPWRSGAPWMCIVSRTLRSVRCFRWNLQLEELWSTVEILQSSSWRFSLSASESALVYPESQTLRSSSANGPTESSKQDTFTKRTVRSSISKFWIFKSSKHFVLSEHFSFSRKTWSDSVHLPNRDFDTGLILFELLFR